MPKIMILTEQDLRKAVKLDLDAVECISSAFAALSSGKVVMPPILTMSVEEYNGEVDVKTAYVPGIDSFAIKMSPGFFDNPKLGLPSTSGLMVLFAVQTGMVEAILLDNGYLTDIRTAAAGAVAAQHLSRVDSSTACIVGTGQQARLQLEALCLVRPIETATIWGRNIERAKKAAKELTDRLNIPVQAGRDLKSAVSSADIIVTTTSSSTPLVMKDWLRPGHHITAMGSDQGHKNELNPGCLGISDIYVPDRRSQTEILGELHHALDQGVVRSTAEIPELGDVVSGKISIQRTPNSISICDLTGTGVQDTAIATYARKRALAASVGIEIEN